MAFPDDDPQHNAILTLTAGQLETLTFLRDSQIRHAGGAEFRELDRQRRAHASELIARGLALLGPGRDGTRRCVPTEAGHAVLERLWQN
jgi:hypothetical protein